MTTIIYIILTCVATYTTDLIFNTSAWKIYMSFGSVAGVCLQYIFIYLFLCHLYFHIHAWAWKVTYIGSVLKGTSWFQCNCFSWCREVFICFGQYFSHRIWHVSYMLEESSKQGYRNCLNMCLNNQESQSGWFFRVKLYVRTQVAMIIARQP